MNQQPLSGLTVLDLSQGIAGPQCTALLARQGANVIKIEPPSGDWIRIQGGGVDGVTALTVVHNLNKRSVCVDLSTEAGRAAVLAIARQADVLVENFRPGVMQRLGLDYATVAAASPRIVYVSITGFGDSGPRAKSPATDTVMQALTGMAWANRDAAGNPRRLGVLVPDVISAVYAAQQISAALYGRDVRDAGQGCHLSISMAECCAAFQAGAILDDFLFPGGQKEPIAVPAGVFATADGHVVLATINNAVWRNICTALDRQAWIDDPRYASNALRAKHVGELNELVAHALAGCSTAEWLERFAGKDVLFAPVQTYAEFRADPQMAHLQAFAEVDQPPFGPVPVPVMPGDRSGRADRPAPAVGEHNREVLAEFGYDDAAIAVLESSGVLRRAAGKDAA